MDNRVYIEYDENNIVTRTHHMPFHNRDGLGKTSEELLKEGALVSPYKVEIPQGKYAIYKYDKDTNSVYVDLQDTPPQEPSVEDKILILEEENADLLLDSATKDVKISSLENDIADILIEIGGM
ncbi:hypothetical protein [Faecalimicrobium sp. JNUCC 81]